MAAPLFRLCFVICARKVELYFQCEMPQIYSAVFLLLIHATKIILNIKMMYCVSVSRVGVSYIIRKRCMVFSFSKV